MRKLFLKAIHLFILLIIGGLLCAVPALAEESESPENSQDQAAQIKSSLENLIVSRQDRMHAYSAAILMPDRSIIDSYHGLKNGLGEFVNYETCYDLGELSNIFIWISAIQLSEKGLLDLNSDIRLYLPEDFKLPKNTKETINFMNLMTHSSGFDMSFLNTVQPNSDEPLSLKDALHFSDARQTYKPKDLVSQSNYASALAAYIIERVSGMSYNSYVHLNILKPMRMNHTSLLSSMDDNLKVKELRQELDSYSRDGRPMGYVRQDYTFYPAMSAVSTPQDIIRLVRGLFRYSYDDLFSEDASYEKLFEAQLSYEANAGPRIAHGFFRLPMKENTWFIYGSTPASSALLEIDTTNKQAFVVMTNVEEDQDLLWQSAQRVFGRSNPTIEKNLENSAKWSGVYQDARSPQHGPSKLASVFMRQIVLTDNNKDLLINSDRFMQQSPGRYFNDSGIQRDNSVVFSPSGHYITKLSYPQQDFFKVPADIFILEGVLIGGALSAALLSIAGIIGIAIYRLRNLRRGSETKIGALPNFVYLLNIILMVIVTMATQALLTNSTSALFKSFLAFGYGYFFIGLIFLVLIAKRLSQGLSQNFKRIHYIICLCSIVVILMNLVYWEIIF